MADPNTPEPRATEPPDPSPTQSIPDGELSTDDLSRVSGGVTPAVRKTRADMAKNVVSNLR